MRVQSFTLLKTKSTCERIDTAIAGESSLREDWMRPEEDKARQDL